MFVVIDTEKMTDYRVLKSLSSNCDWGWKFVSRYEQWIKMTRERDRQRVDWRNERYTIVSLLERMNDKHCCLIRTQKNTVRETWKLVWLTRRDGSQMWWLMIRTVDTINRMNAALPHCACALETLSSPNQSAIAIVMWYEMQLLRTLIMHTRFLCMSV